MNQLVPLANAPLAQFLQGLADYDNQDYQVGLAQQVLYGLGIATAENMPPIKGGESLPDYIERLDQKDLAVIEGLGIGQGQKLQEHFKAATRLILYRQYVTGRWLDYKDELGVDEWSPYVTHLLDDCLRTSEPEGRRWAIAIEVIARLYHPDARDRFGLVYVGDPVVDHETGEIVADVDRGLPATAEDAICESFNRYSREAGVRLRDLLREGTDVQEIQRVLGLATDPELDDKQVNRQATGGKSLMPSLVLPEDFPPAWTAYLTSQFPDVVSSTGSLGMGQRYVQVRWIKWPKHNCGDGMVITSSGPWCVQCWNDPEAESDIDVDGRLHFSIWSMRIADERGRYPTEWAECDKPTEWIEGIAPEYMDIHGLKVSVWEITVPLEELP